MATAVCSSFTTGSVPSYCNNLPEIDVEALGKNNPLMHKKDSYFSVIFKLLAIIIFAGTILFLLVCFSLQNYMKKQWSENFREDKFRNTFENYIVNKTSEIKGF